jgi:hypothetical protein
VKTITVDEQEERLMRNLFEPFSRMPRGVAPEVDAARSIVASLNDSVPIATDNGGHEASAEQAFLAMTDLLRPDLPPERMLELLEGDPRPHSACRAGLGCALCTEWLERVWPGLLSLLERERLYPRMHRSSGDPVPEHEPEPPTDPATKLGERARQVTTRVALAELVRDEGASTVGVRWGCGGCGVTADVTATTPTPTFCPSCGSPEITNACEPRGRGALPRLYRAPGDPVLEHEPIHVVIWRATLQSFLDFVDQEAPILNEHTASVMVIHKLRMALAGREQ